jgi:hypothetical protein
MQHGDDARLQAGPASERLLGDHYWSPGRFASWARTCPGSNESADQVKSTKTRPGDPYLKAALGQLPCRSAKARAPTWRHGTGAARSRRAPVKTIGPIEQHADHDLADGHDWRPLQRPGRDFYTRRRPEKAKSRAIEQLNRDGVPVTLEPLQEPALRESSSQSSGSLPGRPGSPNVALVTAIFDAGLRRGIGRGAFAR